MGIGKAGDNRSQFVGRTGAGINGVGELGYTLCNGAKGIYSGPGNARRRQEGFNSTPAPNTQVLLPSGIIVLGVDDWVIKLADVA